MVSTISTASKSIGFRSNATVSLLKIDLQKARAGMHDDVVEAYEHNRSYNDPRYRALRESFLPFACRLLEDKRFMLSPGHIGG